MIRLVPKVALYAVFLLNFIFCDFTVQGQTCNPNDATASSGYCAPTLTCSGTSFSWSQTINSTNPTSGVTRLISGSTNSFDIPSSTFPSAFDSAVTIDISEVISYDGYSNRVNVNQGNERWRLLFKKNGVVLYASPYTNDVPDYQKQGYWKGALTSNLYFAHGFDEIEIEHYDVANGYNGAGSVIPTGVCLNYSTTPPSTTATCSRVVGNTRGCASSPYVIYLVDNNSNSHLLSGDSADYSFVEYSDGTARFIGEDLSASGLTGTFDVDLIFSSKTTTAPANSPKNSTCFTTGSTGGWEFYNATSGTITASSSTYGSMTIGRMGPAFQVGNNANITQSGFGGSGWLSISGGSGVITAGDINVMLSTCVGQCSDKYAVSVSGSGGSLLHTSNTTTGMPDGSGVKFNRGNSGSSNTYMSWDMGEVLPAGTQVCATVKLEHCSNAASGVTKSKMKFYEKDTSGTTFSSVGNEYWTSNTSYHQFCRTLTADSRYLKIKDQGGCAFRVDALEWEDCDSSLNYIEGTVFYDADVSTTLNSGDNGYAGVTVYLYEDTDGDGILDANETTPIDSAVTDNNGEYSFTVDYSGGTDNFIINTDTDDYPAGSNLTTDNIETASFTSGNQTNSDNDFGYIDPNVISGTVFLDDDVSGTLNSGDVGQSGVTVYLYEDTNGNGSIDASESTPIDSAVTDNNGEYSFSVSYTGGTNNFLLNTSTGSYPAQSILSTDNLEASSFSAGNLSDPNNNFGFYICDPKVKLNLSSNRLVITSESDQSNFTILAENTGNVDLLYANVAAWYTYNNDTTRFSLTNPSYVSGDANSDGVINPGETWTYRISGQTFTYNQGDLIRFWANISTGGCSTASASTDLAVRTFGTNVDIIMPDDCVLPGDTIDVKFITRLLIDEDFEKDPRNSSGQSIPRVQYNAVLNSLTISAVNGGSSFDPFSPPTGVNVITFNQQLADSGRNTSEILDECEPINSIKTPYTGDQDINGEFPDWEFIIRVVVPATMGDSFVITAQDNFDVELLLETGVGTDTFVPFDTLENQLAMDRDSSERCSQDFGDAPDSYGTNLSSDGARHIINSDLYMGFSVSSETDGSPTSLANSDQFDDGNSAVSNLSFTAGDTTNVPVTLVNMTGDTAYLSVMLDVDTNGVFDADEIFEVAVPSSTAGQTVSVPFITPADAVQGNVYMRFRLTTQQGIGASGAAPDGEVEDYSNITAVPVELISLTAKVRNEDVVVAWSTATELNNDYFEVQRRYEHQTEFTTIGEVKGAGTTNYATHYKFIDPSVKWLSPVIYYRLKQVDYDMTVSKSHHVAVTRDAVVEATIYPNPAENVATIAVITDSRQPAEIKVTDMFGKDLTSGLIIKDLGGMFEINLNSLRSGMYFVELTVGKEKVTKRLHVAK